MMFDLPEEQMLKAEKIAHSEGKTAHAWAAEVMAKEIKSRGRV